MNTLPQYVFKKVYDYCYLFSDSEVIMNDDFNEKLISLTDLNKANSLIIDVELPIEFDIAVERRYVYPYPTILSLSEFYEKQINDSTENTLSLFMIDFFMHDNTDSWAAYVSMQHEICIFACDEKVHSFFEVLFRPYEENSFSDIINTICSIYEDKGEARNYIDELERNYHFSKYL